MLIKSILLAAALSAAALGAAPAIAKNPAPAAAAIPVSFIANAEAGAVAKPEATTPDGAALGTICAAPHSVSSRPQPRLHRALLDLQVRWTIAARAAHGPEFARISAAKLVAQACERAASGAYVCRLEAAPCRADGAQR